MDGQQMGGPPQGIQVDIGSLDNLQCEKCRNALFQPVYLMKKVPATHPANDSGQEGIIPIQATYACVRCGNINKEFQPKGQDVSELGNQDVPENGESDEGIISTDLKLEN